MLETKNIDKGKWVIHPTAKVSPLARIYCEELHVGPYCRIDDFAVLTGYVHIEKHSHIPPFTCLYGGAGIFLEEYSGMSPMCQVYSVSDDYMGYHLMGGSVPVEYRGPDRGAVVFRRHAVLGANCIVYPGVYLPEGATFGSFCLIPNNKHTKAWHVHKGIPAMPTKVRSRWVLEEQKRLEEEENALRSL